MPVSLSTETQPVGYHGWWSQRLLRDPAELVGSHSPHQVLSRGYQPRWPKQSLFKVSGSSLVGGVWVMPSSQGCSPPPMPTCKNHLKGMVLQADCTLLKSTLCLEIRCARPTCKSRCQVVTVASGLPTPDLQVPAGDQVQEAGSVCKLPLGFQVGSWACSQKLVPACLPELPRVIA